MRLRPLFAAAVWGVTLASAPVDAEPVKVLFQEGVTRGFPVLRSLAGDKLAQGDLAQVARGDRVDSRMTFRFSDGSLYDEHVVFSQAGLFTLLSYRIVQRGPSFPETIEASFDRESGRYAVRYRADDESPEEILTGRLALPPDVYNGMLSLVVKNLPRQAATSVQIIAFTPQPRLVKMQLLPVGDDAQRVSDAALPVARWIIRPQLGLFASLLVADVPDVNCWIVRGSRLRSSRPRAPSTSRAPSGGSSRIDRRGGR